MSWTTKVVLVAAAIAVSAWLIAGPPIPPFQTFTSVAYDVAYAAQSEDSADAVTSRTASREYRECGMLNHTRPWREEHLVKYASGRRETVPMGNGVEFYSSPMALTIAFLLAIWTGVVLACRRPSSDSRAGADRFTLTPQARRRTQPVHS